MQFLDYANPNPSMSIHVARLGWGLVRLSPSVIENELTYLWQKEQHFYTQMRSRNLHAPLSGGNCVPIAYGRYCPIVSLPLGSSIHHLLGPLPTQHLAASASELFDPNSQHVLQFSVVCGIGYTKFSFLFATVFALFGDRKWMRFDYISEQ